MKKFGEVRYRSSCPINAMVMLSHLSYIPFDSLSLYIYITLVTYRLDY